jgi:hypothetical protein
MWVKLVIYKDNTKLIGVKSNLCERLKCVTLTDGVSPFYRKQYKHTHILMKSGR